MLGHNGATVFVVDDVTRSEATDRELLVRCREGDREAFGTFYGRHREPVLRYFAKRTRQPEVAADLMAEAFARAFSDTIDAEVVIPDVPVAWLFAVSRNLLIDSIRRGKVDSRARRRLALEPLVLDSEDLRRIEEVAAAGDHFEELTASLTAADRELLLARLGEEIPYAELANRLKCSEAVVRKRVSRARSQVRAMLGNGRA